MSLAPPVTSSAVSRSALRSATSFHIPPRSEMSHGTAAVRAKSADCARQSKGRKRRRCCTVTVPPLTVISGAGPSKVARYSSVSDASPRQVDLGGALGELETPRRHSLERGVALHVVGAVGGGLAGPRRRLGGERGDLPFVHAARAAQVVADHRQLRRLASLQQLPRRELHLALDAGADLARRDRGDDEHAAPVRRVRHAVGVAAALQAVEHGGDGAGRQAALLRQLAGGDPPAPVQDAEAAQVGAVEAELQRDRLVQLVAGPAQFVRAPRRPRRPAAACCASSFFISTSRCRRGTLPQRPVTGRRLCTSVPAASIVHGRDDTTN